MSQIRGDSRQNAWLRGNGSNSRRMQQRPRKNYNLSHRQ